MSLTIWPDRASIFSWILCPLVSSPLDLPETVIELDHLDLHDPLVEGHLANVLDDQGPGESGLGERKAQSDEEEADAH